MEELDVEGEPLRAQRPEQPVGGGPGERLQAALRVPDAREPEGPHGDVEGTGASPAPEGLGVQDLAVVVRPAGDDHVRARGAQVPGRPQHLGDVGGEVGVGEGHDLAGGGECSGPHGGALAVVLGEADHPVAEGDRGDGGGEDPHRGVVTAVVDEDDLDGPGVERRRLQARHAGGDTAFLAEHGDHDREGEAGRVVLHDRQVRPLAAPPPHAQREEHSPSPVPLSVQAQPTSCA